MHLRRACSSDDSQEDGTEILDRGLKNSELIFRAPRDLSSEKEDPIYNQGGLEQFNKPLAQMQVKEPIYEQNAVYAIQGQNGGSLNNSDVKLSNQNLGMMGVKQSLEEKKEQNKYDLIKSERNRSKRQSQIKKVGVSQGSGNLIGSELGEDQDILKCPQNPYISVEVSGPMWNNEGAITGGSHRMYKIVTKLKDNPEFPFIQVHRRYSDLEWLIQALQVEYMACIIPPIPLKLNFQGYYSDESEAISERRDGIQRFLDYMIAHRIMCGSDDLRSFLTAQDHDFETKKAEINLVINQDPLNQALSVVLLDGTNLFEPVGQNNTYYGKTANVVKKATNKISKIGGYVSGAVWAGANYLSGGADDQEQAQTLGGKKDLTVDKSGRITFEEIEMLKDLDKFMKDEKFMEQFLKQYTKLEQQFLREIETIEKQSENNSKLSEKFGGLGLLNKLVEDENLNQSSTELLQKTSKHVSQVFTQIQSVKKNQVESQLKNFKLPLQNQRFMIIACMSACQRRRIIVQYIHEKQKEIKKFQQNQSSFQSDPKNQMNMQHQEIYAGGAQISANIENNYHQNFTLSNQNYLHDMKQHHDVIQIKMQNSDKILAYELKFFKAKLIKEFQQIVTDFNETKRTEAKKVSELWDQYLQQIAANDYYQQQLNSSTNISTYSLVGGPGSQRSQMENRKFSFE